VAVLLSIELLDELVFGAYQAAWPSIHADLGLSYAQVGLVISIPAVVASVIEPAFGLLADAGWRRTLILGGGMLFGGTIALAATSHDFSLFLVASIVGAPASGAFVSLSQATLMDLDPSRRELNMATWVAVGSIGVVAGPLLLAATIALGAGWRALLLTLAVAVVPLLVVARSTPVLHNDRRPLSGTWRVALRALRRREVLRWLALVELGDLAGDVLFGFLAVYLVEVSDLSIKQAAGAVGLWATAGLLGDWVLLHLLRRFSSTRYLRLSAAAMALALPAFLLAHGPLKLALVAVIGFLHAGWYALPQARLFDEFPERSGTALAVSNAAALVAAIFPFLMGLAADRFGLETALWAVVLGPVAFLVLLPGDYSVRRSRKMSASVGDETSSSS
jgi:FSR family fosmidomycin resistance protein-like MFS transporter